MSDLRVLFSPFRFDIDLLLCLLYVLYDWIAWNCLTFRRSSADMLQLIFDGHAVFFTFDALFLLCVCVFFCVFLSVLFLCWGNRCVFFVALSSTNSRCAYMLTIQWKRNHSPSIRVLCTHQLKLTLIQNHSYFRWFYWSAVHQCFNDLVCLSPNSRIERKKWPN